MPTREEIEAIKKQQADDAAKKAADEAAGGTNKEGDAGNGDADDGGTDDQNIDYEAEANRWKSAADKEAEARKEAEDALARERFKASEAKKKKKPVETDTSDNEDEDDADKPLTRRELDDRLAQNREQVRRELQAEETTKKIKSITKSDAEANLVNHVFRATRFPSWMTLEEQIENAYLIANKKHITQTNAELMRAISGRGTVTTDNNSSQREGSAVSEPKLDPQTTEMLKHNQYVWQPASRAYIKKLASGRTLFFDPKTKKRWTQ